MRENKNKSEIALLTPDSHQANALLTSASKLDWVDEFPQEGCFIKTPESPDISNGNHGIKKITIIPEAFVGIVKHQDVFERLLAEITPVNFREIIKVDDRGQIKQKNYRVAIVEHLLHIAQDRNWDLCKHYDFTYIYNGAFWKQCSKDDVKRFLGEVALKMGIEKYEGKDYEFKDKLHNQFLADAHFAAPIADEEKVLINLQNGTMEFRDNGWQKRNFNADDFLTYQLPFEYNASATCPLFNQYLLKVLPDSSSRMVLQEFAGFIFTNLNLEKCLVLVGGGGNGKSVFFNIINSLIGKENILNYRLGDFAKEYNRAKLTNVLLNYSSEKGFDLNPDTFKALISGEPLQACLKYGNPFTMDNKVKFIINCNELPRETESTEAYFRRFLIVPFEQTISESEKDIGLAAKIISDELPGVFNWLLEGMVRILQQKKFTECEKSNLALKGFQSQSDNVQLFLDEENLMPDITDNKVSTREIYFEYKNFCDMFGYKAMGCSRFSERLKNKGFMPARLNNGTRAFYLNNQWNKLKL